MSKLLQRYYAKVPYERARGYLERALHEFAESGQPQILHLKLPVNGDGAGLEKDVVVTYARGMDPMHFDRPWLVHWQPKDGGPYPDFDGALTVRADEDFTSCALELEGNYEPPLGTPGKVFDTVFGSRIASATAREFLQRLGNEMEGHYRDEESAKHLPPES